MNELSSKEWREIEKFIYREARLADESDYAGWEALLSEDMHYWVPLGKPNYEPSSKMSIINDNRSRIATRIRQLKSGHRHAQTPVSTMRRTISNIEIIDVSGQNYVVAANFVLHEHAAQGIHKMHIWAGRVTYGLRRIKNEIKMSKKIVELVNSTDALPTLAFII